MSSKHTFKQIKYVGNRPKNDQDNPCRAKLCQLVRNVGCFHEICPEKLYIINLAKDEDSRLFCQEHSKDHKCPFIFWGLHDTPTLNYESFNMDFGPYNLASTHQFCSKLKVWLDTLPYRKSDKHIVVVLDDKDTKKKLNVTLLVAIAAMVLLNLSDEEVIRKLKFSMMHKEKPGEVNKELVFREKKKFKDVSGTPSLMNLWIEDCIRAFYAAIQHKFYDYYEFDPAKYLFYETVMSGDLNWIVPGKILAFAGPCDKIINSKLYHKHPPKFYHDYFKDHNVTTIIRLNEPEYDSSGFTDAGFEHHDLIFPDGYPPTSTIAARFIKMVDEAKGAVAVHCYAGIGRTGTLIAAYLMARYDFTAQMAVAWTRICRPGSVIGGQQDWLYTKFNPLSMLKNNLNSFRPIKSRKTKTNSPTEPVVEDSSQDEPNPKTSYAIAERTLGQAKALLLAKKQRDICDRPCTRNVSLLKSMVGPDSSLARQEQKTGVILDLGKTIPLALSLADLKDLDGENPEFYRLKDNFYEWKVKFPTPGYVELKHDLKKDLQAASSVGVPFDQIVREPVLDFVFRHEQHPEAPGSMHDTNLGSNTTISKLKPVVYYNLDVWSVIL